MVGVQCNTSVETATDSTSPLKTCDTTMFTELEILINPNRLLVFQNGEILR